MSSTRPKRNWLMWLLLPRLLSYETPSQSVAGNSEAQDSDLVSGLLPLGVRPPREIRGQELP